MRRAIDLVHYVVKDGLLQSSSDHVSDARTPGNGPNSSSMSNQPKEVTYDNRIEITRSLYTPMHKYINKVIAAAINAHVSLKFKMRYSEVGCYMNVSQSSSPSQSH
jgi:hypothetical protein